MSDEEGVTPFEAALDAVLVRVTPEPGKGALGTWRSYYRDGFRTLRRKMAVLLKQDELARKLTRQGADVCQHLSLTGVGKARGGKAKVRTGLGKTDRPGSQGGLRNRGPRWN